MLCSGVPYYLIKFRPAKTAQNKNVPKMMGSELHYVDIIFFFPPERESVYQNSFWLRKGSPNYAWKFQQVSSSQECNLKEIVTIKQAQCSYCYRHSERHRVLVASVRLDVLPCVGDTLPPHIHFCMLSLIGGFFKDTLLHFFFILHLKYFSLLCCSGN